MRLDRAQSIAIDPRWRGRGIGIDLRPGPTDATSARRRRRPILPLSGGEAGLAEARKEHRRSPFVLGIPVAARGSGLARDRRSAKSRVGRL